MPKSVARALFIPCALTGLLIGSAGCLTGPKVVTKHDVAAQVSQTMKDAKGNKPESVTCPHDLRPTVGSTLRCTMTFQGRPVAVNVTVTSVEDGNAKFDIVAVVDRNEVATRISQRVADSGGNKPGSVTCPEDLTAVVGATLRCELTDAGERHGVTVGVTSVDGGDVKFNFKVDDEPVSPPR
jgi:predicted thioesterase